MGHETTRVWRFLSWYDKLVSSHYATDKSLYTVEPNATWVDTLNENEQSRNEKYFFLSKNSKRKKIPFYWCLDDQNRLKTVETVTFGLKNLFFQKFVFLVHTVYKEKI